jgi:hypothetical protein
VSPRPSPTTAAAPGRSCAPLDSGVRVTRTNDKGEMEYLDDKQRAAETKHAKDAIAADCPR